MRTSKLKNYTRFFIGARYSSSASTVDAQEINHFGKISNYWWDEFGPMKGLHSMNKLRVPFIRDGLINNGDTSKESINSPKPLKGLSILDVGCGGGILSEPLSKLGAQVTGIDANPNIIDVAKSHAEKGNYQINYEFSSIEDHSKNNAGKYDAIVASEIIEHVTEKEKFLKACSNCLKPMGSFFLTTLNKTLTANFLGIYLMENILESIPKGTHQIEKFIEPHKLQRILEDCDLRTKLMHGCIYNIITNRWHWCSDMSIHYWIHAIKTK